MEENQELKHLCKFCRKSFPCGRSLGGHMRSHLTNNPTEAHEKAARKKLLFGGNGGSESAFDMGFVYELREKPKKSWRIADSKEGNSIHDKLCKQCGKGFPSWKALFGHMKCHSNKEKVSSALEENQSENETSGSIRGRRSKRGKRCMISTANSSSLSCASVSESEQEQEEAVAMSLIMLSRGVGNWGNLNSFAESCDNNSVLKAPSPAETTQKPKKKKRNSASATDGELKIADLGSESHNMEEKKSEISASRKRKTSSSMAQVELPIKSSEIVESAKNSIIANESDQAQLTSSKIKTEISFVPTLKSHFTKKPIAEASDSEFVSTSNKRSKFECITCNKVFYSYQALGGHRASHKKLRGCFASKPEMISENYVETKVSLNNEEDPTSVCEENAEKNNGLRSSRGHECPICLKVFPSGQALGGHKRSHLLVANSEANNNKSTETQNPAREIREFLDLNLPAPVEEEGNSHLVFKAWWMEDGHNHESLLGLISN